MSETIKSKAAKSVLWSAVERFSVQGVQFVLTIVIARLVSPSDYGLIAMLGIASFYNEPELDIIAKVVGLNLIISAFSVVQRAKLTIALNFKLQALISLSSVLISGITGICLAYLFLMEVI